MLEWPDRLLSYRLHCIYAILYITQVPVSVFGTKKRTRVTWMVFVCRIESILGLYLGSIGVRNQTWILSLVIVIAWSTSSVSTVSFCVHPLSVGSRRQLLFLSNTMHFIYIWKRWLLKYLLSFRSCKCNASNGR